MQDELTQVRSVPSFSDREILRRWLEQDGQVTEATALRNATLWACVTLIADSVAQLPRRLYRVERDGSKEVLWTHPVARLMASPTELVDAFSWWRTFFLWLAGWGNAYAAILRAEQGTPLELVAVPPQYVGLRDHLSDPYVVTPPGTGEQLVIPVQDMLHVRGYSLDGVNGVSPVQYHRSKVEQANMQEQYAGAFWKKGARPGGVLETDKVLGQPAVKALRTQFTEIYGAGGEAEGGTAVLDNGLKYHAVPPVAPQDADYVAARRMNAVEICQVFRVPPIFIGLLEGATYDRVEGLNTFMVRHTLGPYLSGLEAQAGLKLIARSARGRLQVQHDPSAFLRLTGKERVEATTASVQGGILSPNEARAEEQRPPKPGGDELWRPVNVVALTAAALAQADEPPAPPPAPPTDPAAEGPPPTDPGDPMGGDPAARTWDVAVGRWVA